MNPEEILDFLNDTLCKALNFVIEPVESRVDSIPKPFDEVAANLSKDFRWRLDAEEILDLLNDTIYEALDIFVEFLNLIRDALPEAVDEVSTDFGKDLDGDLISNPSLKP